MHRTVSTLTLEALAEFCIKDLLIKWLLRNGKLVDEEFGYGQPGRSCCLMATDQQNFEAKVTKETIIQTPLSFSSGGGIRHLSGSVDWEHQKYILILFRSDLKRGEEIQILKSQFKVQTSAFL